MLLAPESISKPTSKKYVYLIASCFDFKNLHFKLIEVHILPFVLRECISLLSILAIGA